MKLEIRAIRKNNGIKPALPAGFGVVAVDNLAALVEVISADFDLTDLCRLRRYQAALNLWWDNGKQAILPIRAGAIFEGPDDIGKVLMESATDFNRRLKLLGNKLQMSVRFSLHPIKEEAQVVLADQNPGIEYMKQLTRRQAIEDQQLGMVDKVVKELSRLAVDYLYFTPTPGATFAEASFLLTPETLDNFKVVVCNCTLPAIVTGPFPPFDFI